ncbi:VOC family protein [Clostridium guangxiense]|uniref:VOC family protein n=1 Tax=Clostridium guangxiense TaxID=1662055 RepID=UPI001E4E2426|nr:VOC family protein [Clostridium guangxiense]MCD2346329.1 VOC family protein [Clostridium guangxiense]
MNCNIKSLYFCVTDMDRAIAFYEDLLEQNVAVHDEIYSVFDINGFRLGLFAYEKMNEKHTFGSNCLPSLEVDSIGILKSKLSKLKIVFPLTKIGANWVAEFEDSEGNHIEITTPINDRVESKE